VISLVGTQQRQFLNSGLEKQTLSQPRELAQFEELKNAGQAQSEMIKNLDVFRRYLLGPTEINADCKGLKGELVQERIWLDYNSFAEHPVRDLKQLKPRFIGTPEIENIYYLTDPTLGGLMKPHIPCYELNQKRRSQQLRRSPLSTHPTNCKGHCLPIPSMIYL
jgi:hypothetical protein